MRINTVISTIVLLDEEIDTNFKITVPSCRYLFEWQTFPSNVTKIFDSQFALGRGTRARSGQLVDARFGVLDRRPPGSVSGKAKLSAGQQKLVCSIRKRE